MTFDLTTTADPLFFQENRLPAHSDHGWYASAAEIDQDRSSFRRSLNGLWKFHYSPNLANVPKGFESDECDVSTWDDIPVPGHIQMHGYDRPQYANVQYPWDGRDQIDPGQIPTRFNPVASYVTTFNVDDWLAPGERLTITFAGAESAVVVWLNGTYVGYATDSFTPSEFDLTEHVRTGSNRLAVQVLKWSGASWLEDQDFFRFSGLFRDVTLNRKPAAHVEDVRVTTHISSDFGHATVSVALKGLVGPDGSSASVGAPGTGVTVSVSADGIGDFTRGEDGVFTAEVSDPLLWSAERPYLYEVIIEVSSDSGETVEVIPVEVGIRRFGIEDGVLKINGERVVFKGVNRHEFGLNGRVVTREETLSDILLMKSLNINAVRTSHYPNNTFLYELCSQYGLYVINEMNLETHGIWDKVRYLGNNDDALPGDKPEWMPALRDRATNMLERDKNHASIVMWSLGNESYGGKNLLELSDFFRAFDSTRPVHYEGVHWDPRYPQTTDVTSQMYTSAADIEAYLKENRDKPFILCEYAHAMGNSFGAVHKYTQLAYREPLYQGGFIWDFADQAIEMTDRHGKAFFGYGGDNGESPHDGDFCGNGILYADHTPKPFVQEVKYLYQPFEIEVGEHLVTVHNRTNFTSTDEFRCEAELAREGEVFDIVPLELTVGPGKSGSVDMPFEIPEDGEYTVTVSFSLLEAEPWAPAGYEVAWGQGVFRSRPVAAKDPEAQPTFELVEGIHNLGVHGEHFSVLFSRLYGGMQSYRYGMDRNGGRELLKAIPMPNFWHAPNSNERGWGAPAEDGQWLLASRYAVARRGPDQPAYAIDGDTATFSFTYDLPTNPPSLAEVTYRVHGDGTVDVTTEVTPGEGLNDMPEFGVMLITQPEFDTLTWYGEGPEESYVDKRHGAKLDVYTADIEDQLAPYLRPQESGSHTGVRWAEVTDRSGRGLRFEHEGEMEFSALPWTPFEVENATHHPELPPISKTVVRPALARRGVGGDDTWGARTHPEYLLPAGEKLTFTFSFRGIM